MKKFIDKILAATGNIGAMERLHVDDHTEAIINEIEDKPFAIAENNVLYAGLNELGGFYFLQTVIIGSYRVKTNKGVSLLVKGDGFNLNLDSDMVELESNFSNVSNRYISKIDFQIEELDIDKIKKDRIEKIVLISKKASLEFKTYAANDEEE